ncbi:MAG: murein hydrolase activator EnvC family protein, partial [Ferrovibrionaceae bacterium]
QQTAALAVPPPAEPQAAAPPPEPEEAPAPVIKGTGQFSWPVKGRVLSGYGPTADGLHNDGINIAARKGEPVRAADGGTVVYAGDGMKGFGHLVLIRHANGFVTAYAHNDVLLVRKGASVRRGQIIARAGQSGGVSEPQVHFEIRKGVQAVNPLALLEPASA